MCMSCIKQYAIIIVYRIDRAPAIYDCPSLVGPTVINRTQILFYCDVNTNLTDPTVRFKVSFLFNFKEDADVPVQILNLNNLRATLHERYLAGRLDKTVTCSNIRATTNTLQL